MSDQIPEPQGFTGEQPILQVQLPGVLAASETIALHAGLRLLLRLSTLDGQARAVCWQPLEQGEVAVLLPLLALHPKACLYEVLLAATLSGETDEQIVAQCQQRLFRAGETGTLEQELTPVREVLSRTRRVLHTCGIELVSVYETGCVLRPWLHDERQEAHG